MIELDNVGIDAGKFSLRHLTLVIPSGKYAVLMGRTGQGKTTMLEAICGLRPIASGRIRIDGNDVSKWSPSDRGIGYVPQDLALFPTFTVREHFAFALRLRNMPREQIRARVIELAEMLRVEPLLDRGVGKLSGGEAQRVAIGRALSFRPSVLLLDEPLSALDEETRYAMYESLRQVQKASQVTTLHITHNSADAAALADLTFRLGGSGIVQTAVL